MKIIAVRIGDRYGPEYEHYLESRLPDYDFIWVRKPMAKNILLQWNKIYGMTLDIDEPVCVMDIDVLLLNDYKKIFDYPIEKGQFLAAPNWWRNDDSIALKKYTINGGFLKYYPKDCHYIYKKFMLDPAHWQMKYIKEGFTSGPVNGEQFFVEDAVKERLELIRLPNAWFCRMEAREKDHTKNTLPQLNRKYQNVTGNSYMFLNDEFHNDIKFVHFTHMDNLPHLWKKYELFV
jgi:extradiol dioxygenase family protein